MKVQHGQKCVQQWEEEEAWAVAIVTKECFYSGGDLVMLAVGASGRGVGDEVVGHGEEVYLGEAGFGGTFSSTVFSGVFLSQVPSPNSVFQQQPTNENEVTNILN